MSLNFIAHQVHFPKAFRLASLKLLLPLIALFMVVSSSAQLKLSGTVIDTSGDKSIKNAVIMAIRLSDSVLVSFTRSNSDGTFLIEKAPIDTFQVLIQSPGFGDKEFIVIGTKENNDFNFGKVAMPPKSNNIAEVVILGYKDPIYFKGDTMVFTADSFKVKENATVEDLLKKLPSIEVDKSGRIKAKGKEVSQVLVDGDEFFGSDPTMATRNLQADAVETVNVYEKKDESAGAANSENITVMDLKLKEEAKKGYFGKASAASDFNKFYEGEFLANKFNNKQKISVFGLFSNTPKATFGYGDSYNYGIEDEGVSTFDGEDGPVTYWGNGQTPQGFPTTRKLGFFYNDKPTESSKVNGNYSYKENQLRSTNSTYSQYFLPDTSYSTDNSDKTSSTNRAHNVRFKYSQNLDSLTTLDIEPSLVQTNNRSTKEVVNRFISEDGEETRSTFTLNNQELNGTDFGTKVSLNRKFKKADRKLKLNYNFNYSEKSSNGNLYTRYRFNQPALADSIVDQDKEGNSLEKIHRATVTFTEPLSKKWKAEIVYDLTNGDASQKRESFNKIGDERVKDPRFSNEFESRRTNNQATGGFIYETRKTRIYFGSNFRLNKAVNHNLITRQDITQTVQNILPKATFRYKFSDYKVINGSFVTSSVTPTIQQLQPVPDNSNPNFVRNGNPDLLPNFANNLDVNFYNYNALSGSSMYTGIYSRLTNNDISSSTVFDQFGRTVSTPINVNGNYFISTYLGGNYTLKPSKLYLDYHMDVNTSSMLNYVNNNRNKTRSTSFSVSPGIRYEGEKLELGGGGSFSLNQTSSTLNAQSNKPYGSFEIRSNFSYKFPKSIFVETDATYTKNTRRAAGYNLDYLIWNASVNKKFFKRENFIVGAEIYDILNQNISASRNVQANVIIDSKTSIIARYLLLKVTYRFDNKKDKMTDDEDMF